MSAPETNAGLALPNDDELSQALTPKLPAWCALTGWHFAAAIGVAMFFGYHNYLHLFYSDLWGHVAYGEWILQHEQLPTEEPFVPLAAGVPVVATAWGGQVLMALATRAGGHEWLSHLFAITVWATYLIFARAFSFRTRHGGVALLAAFGAWCIAWGRHSIVRPEIFGVLCFGTLIWLLARSRHEFVTSPVTDLASDQQSPVRLQSVVTLSGIGVLFAAWANLHGSAIVGAAFMGSYLVGRTVELLWRDRNFSGMTNDSDWRFWFLASLIAVVGMCCNPYGIDLLIHTLLFSNHPNLRDIIEWYPLKMVSLEGITVGASWVLAAVLLRHSRATMRAGDVCVLALFTWAVATKVRMVAWYAPVTMWVLAPHLADVLARVEFDRWRRELVPALGTRSFRWTAVVGLLAWITICFTPISRVVLGSGKPRDERQLYSKGTPLELTRHLLKHPPQGLVCGPQWWGDWLAWQGPPNLNLMVTTNAVHVVPPRVWKDYMHIANAQASAETLLTRYRVNTVVACKKRQQSLIRLISLSPAWEVTYEDDIGLIAVRRGALLASEVEAPDVCESPVEPNDTGDTDSPESEGGAP